MQQPLTTWRCDVCGEQIMDVNDGYVVWRSDRDRLEYDFEIVHKSRCDPGNAAFSNSQPLNEFLGADGLAILLSWVADAGYMYPGRESVREVRDLEEWVDFVRRVQTPWYEEARPYLRDPEVQEQLSDMSGSQPYHPDILEKIAKGEIGREH